jgi:hypothetical protein
MFSRFCNQGGERRYPRLSIRVFEGFIVLFHHCIVVADVEVLGLSTTRRHRIHSRWRWWWWRRLSIYDGIYNIRGHPRRRREKTRFEYVWSLPPGRHTNGGTRWRRRAWWLTARRNIHRSSRWFIGGGIHWARVVARRVRGYSPVPCGRRRWTTRRRWSTRRSLSRARWSW